jgi:hypothetical protein
MRRAIGIAFHGNCRHGDDRGLSEPLLQIVISRLAVNEAKTPTVIVNYDLSMIRILEGRCAAIERGIVEVPFWRSELPNELGKIVSIFFIAGPAAFGRKVILIPSLELSLWRQRHPAGCLAADQITTH